MSLLEISIRRNFVPALAALVMASSPAFAAPSDAALQELLKRVERLEARNAQLEQEVEHLRQRPAATPSPAIVPANKNEAPVADGPSVATRTPEKQDDQATEEPAATEKSNGIVVEAALTTVWQKATGLPHGTGSRDKLNYRADLTVEAPLAPSGGIEHKLFGHLRVGQGQGLNETLGYLGHFNVPNAAAFHASGANPDDATVILGEAWYQAAIPLGQSRDKLEVTFGKVDIFGFFDQNEVAGDEATQFLNVMFVHNPLLDGLGEVGVDANGFQPGIILSYVNERNESAPWRLTLGAFGAGEKSSNYQKTADSPLLIVQAEKTLPFGERAGNYRLYGWTRRDVPRFDDPDRNGRHTGFGISIDQPLGEELSLFARYGHLLRGKLPIDRALSVGAEIRGNAWSRPGDTLGIAGSWLRSSRAYRRAGGEIYLNATSFANQTPDATFTPSGAERVAEIYYRYALLPQFALTPNLQWIQRGGANRHADPVTIFGLRANISY